jgi:hypothetical protein
MGVQRVLAAVVDSCTPAHGPLMPLQPCFLSVTAAMVK